MRYEFNYSIINIIKYCEQSFCCNLNLAQPFLVRGDSVFCALFFFQPKTYVGINSLYSAEIAGTRGFARAKMSNYDTFGNNAKNRFTRLSFVGRCESFNAPLPLVQSTPSSVLSHNVIYLYAYRVIFFLS